jgi:hypothetical protein
MKEPTNSVLLEKINNISETLREFKDETKEHFKVLNGGVAKNTAFRNYAKPILAIAGFVGASLFTYIITQL